jgi:imidazolonepropionase-like amidohydrolase
LGTRLGSIEKGKDGNLVVLTGDPLDSQSWVETVLIDGKVVYERSKDEKLKRILEVKK